MKRDQAIRRAIAFLTNSDGLGFGTQEMGGERFYIEAGKVVAELRAALASPQPLQDDADAPVSVIKDSGPPDNAGAPAPRSAFDRDGEVNRG